MDPLAKGGIALGCVYSAALLGIFLRTRVPDKYQDTDSKDVVRLAMALVVTTVALALGVLVGSAKTFYDTQNAEMAQIAANYIMLDRILSYYGPESADARAELRKVLALQLEGSGRVVAPSKTYLEIKSGAKVGDTLFDKVQRLSPRDDSQRYYKQQCMNLGIQLGQMRWLMYEQNAVPFPSFLLIMLVGWLIVLFVSFGIFAPRNPLVLVGMFASATAVCGAILLILAMYQPQGRLIQVSDTPLRAALQQLGH
jgi:FtsH-binding integral membrane protein